MAGMVGVVLVTIIAAGGREVNAQSGSPRIRPEGAAIRELIEGAWSDPRRFATCTPGSTRQMSSSTSGFRPVPEACRHAWPGHRPPRTRDGF